MNESIFLHIDADVRDPVSGDAEEDKIAGLKLLEGDPADVVVLISRGAGELDADLAKDVLDQAAAIETARAAPSRRIGGTEKGSGDLQDTVNRGYFEEGEESFFVQGDRLGVGSRTGGRTEVGSRIGHGRSRHRHQESGHADERHACGEV
jgi:hypothetical protein